jgi:hypothetical protein
MLPVGWRVLPYRQAVRLAIRIPVETTQLSVQMVAPLD